MNTPVTLTDNDDSWTLDNGIVKATSPEDILEFVGVEGVFAVGMELTRRRRPVEAKAIDRRLAYSGLGLDPPPRAQGDEVGSGVGVG